MFLPHPLPNYLPPPPSGFTKQPRNAPSSLLFILPLHQNSHFLPLFPFSSLFIESLFLLPALLRSNLSPLPLLPPSFSTFASSINHQTPWPSSPTSPPIAAIEISSHPKGQIFSNAFPRTLGGHKANFMENHPNFSLITSFLPHETIQPSTAPDSKLITRTLLYIRHHHPLCSKQTRLPPQTPRHLQTKQVRTNLNTRSSISFLFNIAISIFYSSSIFFEEEGWLEEGSVRVTVRAADVEESEAEKERREEKDRRGKGGGWCLVSRPLIRNMDQVRSGSDKPRRL